MRLCPVSTARRQKLTAFFPLPCNPADKKNRRTSSVSCAVAHFLLDSENFQKLYDIGIVYRRFWLMDCSFDFCVA